MMHAGSGLRWKEQPLLLTILTVCTIILVAVTVLIFISATAQAASRCLPHDLALKRLEAYGEREVGLGISSNGQIAFSLLRNEDGSSWTFLATDTRGMSCLRASGKNWVSNEFTPRADRIDFQFDSLLHLTASSSKLSGPCRITMEEATSKQRSPDVVEMILSDVDMEILLLWHGAGRIDELRVFLIPRESRTWVALIGGLDGCFVFPMSWRDVSWLDDILGQGQAQGQAR